MAKKTPFLFVNDSNQLETSTGYIYDKTITREGLVEHYKTLVLDLEYIAKEYNKMFPATSLLLYVISDCIREGSVEEVVPFMERFLEEKTKRVHEGTWDYGRRRDKKG